MVRDNKPVWVIDDDASIRWVLEKALRQEAIDTRSFESGEGALAELERNPPRAVICDIRMPGMDGLAFLDRLQGERPRVPVIIMTAHSDLDSAVSAYQGGAFDYLPKPFDVDEALAMTRRALAHAEEQKYEEGREAETPGEIIGEAPAMQEVFRAIGRLAHSHVTVLINGESGTGKELVARALHNHSPRRGGPFIALNMAAIPRDLIESELFGHEKGAFTGAGAQRVGRFEQASGGTLFLDEIGDMPPEAQTRLLRILSDGQFYRVGGRAALRADVRIIAATHQDLEALVKEKGFREDLFHRLNVIRIHIPRLSERAEDIPMLARHFLHQAARELNMETKTLLPATEDYLRGLDWPGNVRQLENTCRWLTVMASGRELHVEDLPPELMQRESGGEDREDWDRALRRWTERALSRGERDILAEALPRFERSLIETALQHSHGRKREAAQRLGWGRNTLTRKLKELGMTDSADD